MLDSSTMEISRLHGNVGWRALVAELTEELDGLHEQVTVAGVDSWDEYQKALGQMRAITLVIKRVQDAHNAVMEANR